jgi:hypothetical protein
MGSLSCVCVGHHLVRKASFDSEGLVLRVNAMRRVFELPALA